MDLILFHPHAASFISYMWYGNSIAFASMQRLFLIGIWMQKLSVLLNFLVKSPAAAGWAAGPALRFSSTLFNLFVLFPLRSRTLPLFHALNVYAQSGPADPALQFQWHNQTAARIHSHPLFRCVTTLEPGSFISMVPLNRSREGEGGVGGVEMRGVENTPTAEW